LNLDISGLQSNLGEAEDILGGGRLLNITIVDLNKREI